MTSVLPKCTVDCTKPIFTTGEVAKICRVAPRTVCKWFDQEEFPNGYILPTSNDRRIPVGDLTKFLHKWNMPQACHFPTTEVVLMVGCSDREIGEVYALLPKDRFSVKISSTILNAGTMLVTHPPKHIVINLGIGQSHVRNVADSVQFPLVIIAPEGTVPEELEQFFDHRILLSQSMAPGYLASAIYQTEKSK